MLKIIWPVAPTPNVFEPLLLLLTPVPLIISSPPMGGAPGEMFKVKEAEPEVNTMLFTSCGIEMFTFVCED